MANKATSPSSSSTEHEEMFPAWVYNIPAVLLLLGGAALIIFASLS